MPKLTEAHPGYRLHRKSGLAVVTLCGVDFYLGPHGTKASKLEYERLIGEWLAAGRQLPSSKFDLTITELVERFWRFAKPHYRKNGKQTREIDNIKSTVRPLLRLYGDSCAAEFGPLRLKALRNEMIELGWSRAFINSSVCRVRRIFKWGVSEEIVPANVLHGLQSVAGLQVGRSDAREPDPILPVDDATIEATLPHLPPAVRDMVRIGRLTGCRPEEIRIIRPGDIDRTANVWVYRPFTSKMMHKQRVRTVAIGPRAQAILLPYLDRPADSFCFQPAESEAKRKAELRANRKTKVQPSQIDRRKKRPKKQPGQLYSREDYARAIRLACDKANVPRWAPNRLRHTAATEVRRRFGLEGAQTVLSHSRANTTEIYAERDSEFAKRIMAEIG